MPKVLPLLHGEIEFLPSELDKDKQEQLTSSRQFHV